MNKKIFYAIFALALIAQLTLQVNSYPGIRSGTAECIDCHNEPISTMYDPTQENVSATLDGRYDEVFYDDNTYSALYIPVGNNIETESGEHEFEFVRTYFAQNGTHVFFVFRLHDDNGELNGGTQFDYSSADKFAIMWNINASTTGKGFPTTMEADFDLTEDGQEMVDLWTWYPTWEEQEAYETDGTSTFEGVVEDGFYGPHKTVEGIPRTDFASYKNDLAAGARYVSGRGGMDLYLELARPLVTDDDTDIQFDHTGFYEFSIALWLDGAGGAHHVSFPHMLWVTNPDSLDAGYDVTGEDTKTEVEVDYTGTETVYETVQEENTVEVTNQIVETVYAIGDTVNVTVNEINSEAPLAAGIVGATLTITGIMVYSRKRR
ncbi:MAG: hypothetical protein INQ03_23185 [Candidatus Heimdallarchaeota archaeon]|nr:hypothetical protein [Candidatus Heimdallarchaeota archaeon]